MLHSAKEVAKLCNLSQHDIECIIPSGELGAPNSKRWIKKLDILQYFLEKNDAPLAHVETTIEEDRFIAEFRIPFNSMFYDSENPSWRFNIYRGNTQEREFSIWVGEYTN